MRERRVTPHVAQNTSGRRSAIDGRTTRHPGYAVSQRIRKRIEEGFGWMKTIAGLKKTKSRARKGRMVLYHGSRCLQSHPATQAQGCGMTTSSQSSNHDLNNRCTSLHTGLI